MATSSPPSLLPSRVAVAERSSRLALIKAIEAKRQSRVITYVTAIRPDNAIRTLISSDFIPLLHDHLRKIGKTTRIDLLLCTHGGDTLTPHAAVHLLREYCETLGVLVPSIAMSSGTLFALGANEIVMGPMGRLGPVDPTVQGDFNPVPPNVPVIPGTKIDRLGISVEDVSAYFSLMKDKAGLGPSEMVEVVKELSKQVHPLALGNVHRKYMLIRTLSQRLLRLHMTEHEHEHKIKNIVDVLTEKLYAHDYQISRYEAEKIIGLPVVKPADDLADAMWELSLAYRRVLRLDSDLAVGPMALDGAVVESAEFTSALAVEATVSPGGQPGGGITVAITKAKWETLP